ncbi:Gfo/Idh/MocA family oxidoreductase [Dysgonomonadaceae bacterium zrk40]|nr:Gfo/Idh/MocA family oxidoreductase [Dysgonomonadaceae bacterium zrk40]
MNSIVNWGVLSTAKIGREQVIPAIQASQFSRVLGIGSENSDLAKTIASQHGIERIYNSYKKLLKDPQIEAVYIPLPNHLHVEWSIKALEAGKHVLCEKPIGLNSTEAEKLLEASEKYPHLKIMEAFMYRHHSQWHKVKSMVDNGTIGKIKSINLFFSYYNTDPDNIRNKIEVGGGALMDIGCYCISFARFILNSEPEKVIGLMDMDPEMKTDRLTTGILTFSTGATASFTCSTQLMPYQRVNIVGEKGRIEVEIPVNAPTDKMTHVWIYTNECSEEVTFNPENQYTLQADYFSKAIIEDHSIAFALNDAVNNMRVIDAIVKSNKEGRWVNLSEERRV